MNSRIIRLLSILLIVTLAGCSSLPNLSGVNGGRTLTPGTSIPLTTLPFETGTPSVPAKPAETISPSPPAGGLLVRLWVPPEFNPDGKSPANDLLKARLEQFMAENPDIRLEVRVKALEGTGGLLDSLVAANVAAPLALPDLVLLPRPLLESATLKGLLYPYDSLTKIMDDSNWFEYARQLAQLQSSTYGIPFAGDVLSLAYHPSVMSVPPPDLQAALALGVPLLFPATDPQAIYTLDTYLAEGGKLQDTQGRPALDLASLTQVLEIDQRASQAGVMPYWLTQYSTDAQVWEAFLGSSYPMAVTWASSYLGQVQSGAKDLAVAPIPTSTRSASSFASGWSWALAGQDPERRAAAVRLAEFLVDKDFLAQWTQAAGYLPTRKDALESWQSGGQRQVLEQISSTAVLLPPVDVLSSLGPAVEQAVVDVLKAQSDPQSAAQAALDQISQP